MDIFFYFGTHQFFLRKDNFIMKKIISLVLVSAILIFSSLPVLAAPNEFNNTTDSHFSNISAVITDDITGETIIISPQKISNHISINDGNSITEEATATFTLPTPGIIPFYSDTSITETDVEATVKINYDRSGRKIRVNGVSGSWVPSLSLINISNREVHYGDGAPFSHSAHKYPTSNYFSYTTGWGWVNWYPASQDAMTGARAFTSATVSVTGMTPHTIEVFVIATK